MTTYDCTYLSGYPIATQGRISSWTTHTNGVQRQDNVSAIALDAHARVLQEGATSEDVIHTIVPALNVRGS